LDILWSARERALAPSLLARALTGALVDPGLAGRLAVACGGVVLVAVATELASAPPEARAALADAAGESALSDPTLVQTLLADADETVRRAARRAQVRLKATPRPPVRIVSLGGFSVWRGRLPIPELSTGRQKARTLLAILLSADGAMHREVLLEHLWADLPPERGLAALHSALYALRRVLEPGSSRQSPPTLVVTDGEAYCLRLSERDEWDATTFVRLARAAAQPAPLETRLDRLLAAEAAWGGSYLPEWPYEDWAATRRAQLDRSHERVLEGLAEALAEAGQPRAALARWQQLVELDPVRESWQRALITAYAWAGERALALRQYQACRTLLRESLGVEPSRETTALYTSLL
jgi:DNA-binding SARP family transcriptional activator